MAEPPAEVTLTARYVFPVSGPPLEWGHVTIRGERLGPIGRGDTGQAVDLGNVAIVPGLVNAHTHLEFSDLTAPLGIPGMPLPEWIRQVIATRAARSVDATGAAAAIERGLAECARAGSTTIGEIATGGWTHQALETAPCDLTVFFELIGLAEPRVAARLQDAEQFVARALSAVGWHGGLSPHAPYSVHPELLVAVVRLAAANCLPVAMHVAESREELELLADGTGSFREMLESLGAWDESAIALGCRPRDYLQVLSAAPRAVVIHGNYLAADQRALLSEHADRMSLVYCPRTHAFFRHERYPLAEMLAEGVHVAIGTDSRASNPDLDMLAELRHLARAFPELSPAAVLRLGTLAGAEALGRAHDVGSLEEGKLADLAIVPLPAERVDDPHELVFGSDLPVAATYYRGRPITGGNS